MSGKTGLSYQQLETAFQHENFEPLYFLYGEEQFLIDELQDCFLKHALNPSERDFNLDIVYGAEAEATSVLALCAGYPVMAARRVVIVRDFEKLKGNRQFKDYAEKPNPSAVVMLICGDKPNVSAHPYRALRRHAAWSRFKTLYDNEMPGWIKQRVEAQGYRIEPKAVRMLSNYVGTDLRSAAAEIEKLTTFAGRRGQITGEDVVRASGQTREFNVFELQEALGQGRYTDALRTADRMLQQASNASSEAIMIVAVLNAYFTKLWKLLACQGQRLSKQALAKRIGVSPYFVKEYQISLRRFGPEDVEQAFSALLAADYELKGGSNRDERLIVTLLMKRLIPGEKALARSA